MRWFPKRLSLVDQAAQLLREGLEQGLWARALPGERVLCERLGVSRPTLRAAVERLRREGRLAVAHGRPTRIVRTAPRAALPRAAAVALLSPVPLRAMPPFVMYWVDELREHLGAAGHPLELHVNRAAYAERPDRALECLVRRAPSAAWVLYLSTAAMQRWFQRRGLPCLVAGSCTPGTALPSVDVDYRAVCRHAAGVLLASGRKTLALVLPDVGYAGDLESEGGFREAFARTGNRAVAPIVVRHNGTVKGLCRALDASLSSTPRAEGLIIARSAHVLTVITHLLRRGVRVPRDVAVISRDDDAFLEFVLPAVARYGNHPAQYAQRLSRATIQLAEQGAGPARAVRLIPRFLPGETI